MHLDVHFTILVSSRELQLFVFDHCLPAVDRPKFHKKCCIKEKWGIFAFGGTS
jgi:hypothetical protein